MDGGRVRIRRVTPEDVPAIIGLLRDLAEFEKLDHKFRADESSMHAALFGPHPYIEALIAESLDETSSTPATASPLRPAFTHPRTSSSDPSVLSQAALPRTYTAGGFEQPATPQKAPLPDPELGDALRPGGRGDIEGGLRPMACAVYYFSFSTFACKPNLYVEDVFVQPAFRARGVGTTLFAAMAQVALQRGCARMEWSVLRWNARAIDFYSRLGAHPNSEWEVYHLPEAGVAALAARLPEAEGRLLASPREAREEPLSLSALMSAVESSSRRHSLS